MLMEFLGTSPWRCPAVNWWCLRTGKSSAQVGVPFWLRNNVSTILCNCLENFGFITLAFVGIYDAETILIIATSTSIVEMIVALLDTPFLYIAKRMNNDKQHILHVTEVETQA